jgi:hypothetical protein
MTVKPPAVVSKVQAADLDTIFTAHIHGDKASSDIYVPAFSAQ